VPTQVPVNSKRAVPSPIPDQGILTTTGQAVLLSTENGPPSELRLFKAGENPTEKGTFLLDADGLALILKQFSARGVRAFIDYAHASCFAKQAPNPAEAAKNAGSFVLTDRAGELWATDIRWTPTAAEYLKNKEYLYVSPVLAHDGEGRIIQVHGMALTNDPATHDASPLVLSKRTSLMTAAEKLAQLIALARGLVTLETVDHKEPDGDEVLEARKALEALTARLAKMTGKKTLEEALTALSAYAESAKSLASELATVRAELANTQAAQVATSVQTALESGQISPAQKDWAVEYAARDPQGFGAYLATAPKLVARKPAAQPEIAAVAHLSAQEREICAAIGCSEEDYIKFNKRA